jgi:hypothetical protein
MLIIYKFVKYYHPYVTAIQQFRLENSIITNHVVILIVQNSQIFAKKWTFFEAILVFAAFFCRKKCDLQSFFVTSFTINRNIWSVLVISLQLPLLFSYSNMLSSCRNLHMIVYVFLIPKDLFNWFFLWQVRSIFLL